MMKNVWAAAFAILSFIIILRFAARRLTGFHDAMHQEGIADFQERTFYGLDFSEFDARIIFKKMLQKYPEFTAIVTAKWRWRSAYDKSNGLGSIPMEETKIALTGFGNVAESATFFRSRPLISILPSGKCAAERMFEVIQNNEPGKSRLWRKSLKLLNLQNIRRIYLSVTLSVAFWIPFMVYSTLRKIPVILRTSEFLYSNDKRLEKKWPETAKTRYSSNRRIWIRGYRFWNRWWSDLIKVEGCGVCGTDATV